MGNIWKKTRIIYTESSCSYSLSGIQNVTHLRMKNIFAPLPESGIRLALIISLVLTLIK